MRIAPPRAVVFDFDGVLADTEGLHLAAFQEVLGERGWTLDRDAYFSRYLGYDDPVMLRLYLDDQSIELSSDQFRALLTEKTRRFQRRVATGQVLFSTATSAVKRLGAHYRLGIASGSMRHEILGILNANGLTSDFAAVVGCDDVPRSKPAPDSYAEAVKRLGVEPAAAVAIEDSHWGITSAKAAGLRVIGLTTSSSAQVLENADSIVRSLDEVTRELIERV